MYREGQKVFEQGMSRGASIALGIVAAVISAGMVAMAPTSGSPLGFHVFGLFCAVIAIVCLFTGKVRRVSGRLLGAAVFLASFWYLAGELAVGSLHSDDRSQPSIINAASFALAAGIPGLLYAVFGRFTWRRAKGIPE